MNRRRCETPAHIDTQLRLDALIFWGGVFIFGVALASTALAGVLNERACVNTYGSEARSHDAYLGECALENGTIKALP